MLSNAHKAIPDIEKLNLSSVINEVDYSSHIEKLKRVLEEEKQENLQRAKTVKRIRSLSIH